MLFVYLKISELQEKEKQGIEFIEKRKMQR